MTVLRIVPDLETPDPAAAQAFWGDILGLDCVMDQGWIATFEGQGTQKLQISFASEGGNGTPVPAVSVEVDDLDTVLEAADRQGLAPEYGPVTEPWGVRRAFLRDPSGHLVNVMTHI